MVTEPPVAEAGAKEEKSCMSQSWSSEAPVLTMQNLPTLDFGPTTAFGMTTVPSPTQAKHEMVADK